MRIHLVAGLLALGTVARADVLPDGQHSVSYAAVLENGAEFGGDWAFFVYPYSSSGGAPTTEYLRVDVNEAFSVGRWHSPELWAIRKSDLEAHPLPATVTEEDPAFVQNAAMKRSGFHVSSVQFVDDDVPVTGIRDLLRIVALDENGFQVKARAVVYTLRDGGTEELAYGTNGVRPEPTDKPSNEQPTTEQPKTEQKKEGNSCATAGASSLVALALFVRARRRR